MKKLVYVIIALVLIFISALSFDIKKAKADIWQLEVVAPNDGYYGGAMVCPNGKTVYRCYDGASGCNVSKQELCDR